MLSLTEREALRALAKGPLAASEVFAIAQQKREPQPFMGDLFFFAVLRDLLDSPRPPLAVTPATRRAVWPRRMLRLTPVGRAVLDGKLDWQTQFPLERWVGGIAISTATRPGAVKSPNRARNGDGLKSPCAGLISQTALWGRPCRVRGIGRARPGLQARRFTMAWLILFVAGLCEIGWAVGLKYTDGFTRLVPTVLTAGAMVVSLVLLGIALKTLPVGTGYAVWTGIGAVGTAILGIVLLGKSMEPARLVSIGLIVAGIVGLKLATPGAEGRSAELAVALVGRAAEQRHVGVGGDERIAHRSGGRAPRWCGRGGRSGRRWDGSRRTATRPCRSAVSRSAETMASTLSRS